MVPCLVCSTTNLCSSSCSACDSSMSLRGRAADALGLSSITWSQMCDGGNSCKASSENTLEYYWYCSGIFGSIRASLGLTASLPMYSVPLSSVLGLLTHQGRNHALDASGARSIMGSWVWSIHPLLQSIQGWNAVNHGYPRIALFSPRSERKNQRVERCVSVCTWRSVKYCSSPLWFEVPSTLYSLRGSWRCLMGSRRYFVY